jgi:hypothetical protein
VQDDALAEQVEAGAAVHLPFDHLDLVDRALDPAGVPVQGQAVGDGLLVVADADGEGALAIPRLDRPRATWMRTSVSRGVRSGSAHGCRGGYGRGRRWRTPPAGRVSPGEQGHGLVAASLRREGLLWELARARSARRWHRGKPSYKVNVQQRRDRRRLSCPRLGSGRGPAPAALPGPAVNGTLLDETPS